MIRLIAACDSQRGITKNGHIPWDLPSDARYFAKMTKQYGGVVLMGRGTFEAIGEPLAGRDNYVLSQTLAGQSGITVIRNLEKFLQDQPEVWVIGGSELYAETLLMADKLYITELEADFNCDKFFPEYKSQFVLDEASEPVVENNIRYRFCTYRQK